MAGFNREILAKGLLSIGDNYAKNMQRKGEQEAAIALEDERYQRNKGDRELALAESRRYAEDQQAKDRLYNEGVRADALAKANERQDGLLVAENARKLTEADYTRRVANINRLNTSLAKMISRGSESLQREIDQVTKELTAATKGSTIGTSNVDQVKILQDELNQLRSDMRLIDASATHPKQKNRIMNEAEVALRELKEKFGDRGDGEGAVSSLTRSVGEYNVSQGESFVQIALNGGDLDEDKMAHIQKFVPERMEDISMYLEGLEERMAAKEDYVSPSHKDPSAPQSSVPIDPSVNSTKQDIPSEFQTPDVGWDAPSRPVSNAYPIRSKEYTDLLESGTVISKKELTKLRNYGMSDIEIYERIKPRLTPMEGLNSFPIDRRGKKSPFSQNSLGLGGIIGSGVPK